MATAAASSMLSVYGIYDEQRRRLGSDSSDVTTTVTHHASRLRTELSAQPILSGRTKVSRGFRFTIRAAYVLAVQELVSTLPNIISAEVCPCGN